MASKRKATDQQVLNAYAQTGSVWKAGELLGMGGQTVHERLQKLDADTSMNLFTEKDFDRLRAEYSLHASEGTLDKLAASMGRTAQFIARKARILGLTNPKRSKAFLKDISRFNMLRWLSENEHPRGMLGKKHSAAAKAMIAESSAKRWRDMTREEKAEAIKSQQLGRGLKGTKTRGRIETTWKGAWREIDGQKHFFRSRWEANYARVLGYWRENGVIAGWDHEPKTFTFDTAKKGGPYTYLPDFLVKLADGREEYHEVKGWMDRKSVAKLRRMRLYHPDVTLVLVDKDSYKELSTEYATKLEGWE